MFKKLEIGGKNIQPENLKSIKDLTKLEPCLQKKLLSEIVHGIVPQELKHLEEIEKQHTKDAGSNKHMFFSGENGLIAESPQMINMIDQYIAGKI